MKEFKIDYDEDNDSLFVYLEGSKSKGAIEVGNFVFDFDGNGNLIAMEVLDASEALRAILSKVIELKKIKEFKADIINFRNTTNIIRFNIVTDFITERGSIIIPKVVESPALDY